MRAAWVRHVGDLYARPFTRYEKLKLENFGCAAGQEQQHERMPLVWLRP